MGLCIECKYYMKDASRVPPYYRRFYPVNFIRPWLMPGFYESSDRCCKEDNVTVDFVTGKVCFPPCGAKNRFEECPYWEESPDTGEKEVGH